MHEVETSTSRFSRVTSAGQASSNSSLWLLENVLLIVSLLICLVAVSHPSPRLYGPYDDAHVHVRALGADSCCLLSEISCVSHRCGSLCLLVVLVRVPCLTRCTVLDRLKQRQSTVPDCVPCASCHCCCCSAPAAASRAFERLPLFLLPWPHLLAWN
jgi:hypothetical protein